MWPNKRRWATDNTVSQWGRKTRRSECRSVASSAWISADIVPSAPRPTSPSPNAPRGEGEEECTRMPATRTDADTWKGGARIYSRGINESEGISDSEGISGGGKWWLSTVAIPRPLRGCMRGMDGVVFISKCFKSIYRSFYICIYHDLHKIKQGLDSLIFL